MEENENKRRNYKKWYFLLIILLVIFIIMLSYYMVNKNKNENRNENENENDLLLNGYEEISYSCKSGDSNRAFPSNYSDVNDSGKKVLYKFFTSYEEFEKYNNDYGDKIIISTNSERINSTDYFDEEFFKEHNLALEAHDGSYSGIHYEIDKVSQKNNTARIDINFYTSYGGPLSQHTLYNFIILNKDIYEVEFQLKDIKPKPSINFHHRQEALKPIIYLYPTEDTEVSVKLKNKDKITTSYPKYYDSWNVIAKKDGNLIDINTKRNLYSLYYENENSVDFKIEKDGFIVKGNDVAKFLEEKLEILGLNERETEEFIIYWLPKLEKNKYNYIRFATSNEINTNMPLEITPTPDKIIRILMTFKRLEEPIKVEEQKLKENNRTGFTVVEWGGTEIK